MILALVNAACGERAAMPPAGASWPALQAKDGLLVDGSQRQVLLRGVNVRARGLFDVTFDDGRTALEPIPPFGREDCRFLAEDLGLNFLRLPINWSAIEPVRGRYEDAYLDRVLELVEACREVGVLTLVDLHQDAYSKEIGEDGAPYWAIVPPPPMRLGGPLEDLGSRRTSKPVLDAFASLYGNVDGLADAYARMAAHVASRLVGQAGVIGLELQNEPVPLGDQAALDAFHARVTEAVRAAAPALPVAFEPDSLRNLQDSARVDKAFGYANAIYAPHVYTQVFQDGWQTEDVASLRASVDNAVDEARAHGAPLLVGEFGASPTDPHGLRFTKEALTAFDAARASWAFWVYEEWTQGAWGLYDAAGEARGALRGEIADTLARPFPEAVAGRLEAISLDDGVLTVRVSGGRGVHRFTVPRRTWSAGATVTCDGTAARVTPAGPGRIDVECTGTVIVLGRARRGS